MGVWGGAPSCGVRARGVTPENFPNAISDSVHSDQQRTNPTPGGNGFTEFPGNQLTTVYAVQAALAQEVTGQRSALKISSWTLTVHPHKH